MKNKVIEVRNLNFENVLKDISLNIFEGDFVAIIGPNGGGKSTWDRSKFCVKQVK